MPMEPLYIYEYGQSSSVIATAKTGVAWRYECRSFGIDGCLSRPKADRGDFQTLLVR